MFPWGGSGDPFERMHRQMQQSMEEMQRSMFGGNMHDPFFGGHAQGAQSRSGRSAPTRQPTVEEVEDHHEHVDHEPVVEEPDDAPRARNDRAREGRAYAHEQQRGHHHPYHDRAPRHPFDDPNGQQLGAFGGDPFAGFFGGMGMPGMGGLLGGMMTPSFPDMAAGGARGGGGTSYSYSSTYSSSSGPGGVTYEESRTSRRGPNGVTEERRTVRDGRSGEEHMRLTRGLGERQRTLERRRRHGGDEERSETLQGIEHGEAQRFDEQWQEAAQQHLGGGGRRGSARREAQPQLGFGESERWI